ncbi:helix-turn-helix domain-containing protein [Bifidobacterium saguinibicoloris]|uniref:helix-turn-helix domain-containing protein n=1 Tax=Bifidobacterium saguinibicoloris TaxID=2834433 RepID=UPI001C58BA46|nr:helix-turn-helix domain-containing protein [Bifidobacterium saguinibicoloris]MBW3080669.1 helix-turn-helix domain-containing protein [Bifidobacterium saguinibicoloris]
MAVDMKPVTVVPAFAEIAAKLAPLNGLKETSAITGIPVNTLNDWRSKGKHLRFVKIGRSVFYTRDDIMSYLESHVFSSTAEARKANR